MGLQLCTMGGHDLTGFDKTDLPVKRNSTRSKPRHRIPPPHFFHGQLLSALQLLGPGLGYPTAQAWLPL